MCLSRFGLAAGIQDAEAEVVEVAHPKRPPENGPQLVVEAFGSAVTGASYEVVGDQFEPVLQGCAERFDGLRRHAACLLNPFPQAAHSRFGRLCAAVLEQFL